MFETASCALNTLRMCHFSSPIAIKRTKKKHCPPYQKRPLCMLYRKNTRYCFLSTAYSNIQGRNRFPCMNKVFPPPMHGRYFHSYLTSIRNYLGGNQSHTTPYPFNMLLSVGFWQYQIPYPERQIVGQLRTQKIYPVCKKLSHRKMAEKLIRKLANPFLTLSTLRVGLHKLMDIALTIGYYRIVSICRRLKERALACLVLFPFPFCQIPIPFRPPHRLIRHLGIFNGIVSSLSLCQASSGSASILFNREPVWSAVILNSHPSFSHSPTTSLL